MKQLHAFTTRSEASTAAATALATAITDQLTQQTHATVVASGGSSPSECFGALSREPLAWSKVRITLSDERCVAADHPDSNERMVREQLMIGPAASASFYSPEQPLPEPFAAVLLGMGADGHFASLFADASTLAAGLDLAESALVLPINTTASPHPRISMPLARLLRTDCLILLAFGADKRAVIDNPLDKPVQALFEQSITPVQIYWAP